MAALVTAIRHVAVQELLDGAGGPAVRVQLTTVAGQAASAIAVFTGRTSGLPKFAEALAQRLRNVDATDQGALDGAIVRVASDDDSASGVTLAASLAGARLGAKASGHALVRHLRQFAPFSGPHWSLPLPLARMLTGESAPFRYLTVGINPRTANGRKRAAKDLVALLQRITTALAGVIRQQGFAVVPEASGAFGIAAHSVQDGLALLKIATRVARCNSREARFGVTVAPTEVAETATERLATLHVYERMVKRCGVALLEDAFGRDYAAAAHARRALSSHAFVVGGACLGPVRDDLDAAFEANAFDAVTVPLSSFPTLSAALHTVVHAKENDVARIITVGDSETNDDFVVDFALACNAEYLELGAPIRGEHVAKWNRFLQLTEEFAL